VTLKTEKELKKEGRGTSDYRVDESEKLIVVRWYNRTVDVRKFLTILVLILQIKFGDGKKKPQNLLLKLNAQQSSKSTTSLWVV
jgi:hypothetical protein